MLGQGFTLALKGCRWCVPHWEPASTAVELSVSARCATRCSQLWVRSAALGRRIRHRGNPLSLQVPSNAQAVSCCHLQVSDRHPGQPHRPDTLYSGCGGPLLRSVPAHRPGQLPGAHSDERAQPWQGAARRQQDGADKVRPAESRGSPCEILHASFCMMITQEMQPSTSHSLPHIIALLAGSLCLLPENLLCGWLALSPHLA